MTEKSEGCDICEDMVEAVDGETDATDADVKEAALAKLEVGGLVGPLEVGGLVGPFQLGSKRADSSSVSGELPDDCVVTLEKVHARARGEEYALDGACMRSIS